MGGKYSRIACPTAIIPNRNSDRVKNQYNKLLEELCNRNRTFETLLLIQSTPMEEEVFIRETNEQDNEVEDFMNVLEVWSNKKEECTK